MLWCYKASKPSDILCCAKCLAKYTFVEVPISNSGTTKRELPRNLFQPIPGTVSKTQSCSIVQMRSYELRPTSSKKALSRYQDKAGVAGVQVEVVGRQGWMVRSVVWKWGKSCKSGGRCAGWYKLGIRSREYNETQFEGTEIPEVFQRLLEVISSLETSGRQCAGGKRIIQIG